MTSASDNAIIQSILAREALAVGALGAPQAPRDKIDDIYSLWQDTAAELAGCPVSLGVIDPGYPRSLNFHPSLGLRLVERNGTDAVPWSDAPPAVLVRHVSLLNRLLAQAAEQRARHGAILLATSAAATVLMTVEDVVESAAGEPVDAEGVAEEPAGDAAPAPVKKRVPPVAQPAGPGAVLSAAADAAETAAVKAVKRGVVPVRRGGRKK